MEELPGLESLAVVAVVAALAPVLAALVPGHLVPQIVLLILGGIAVGPQGLGWADSESLALLSNVGLGFVFLLAGFEIDPAQLRSRQGGLALIAWISSALLSGAVVGALAAVGYVDAFGTVALALTTTALGTVLPILGERGMLASDLGRHFLAGGAMGELLPIVGMAVFLGVNSRLSAILSLAVVALVALVLARLPRLVRGRRVEQIVAEGADTLGQTTVRWTLVLLLGLLVLAGAFGIDVVLGAFLAGAVLRHWTPGDTWLFEKKLDALGYGFFIPVFFVTSGIDLDVAAIRESPDRLLVFVSLLLFVRGLPVLLVYRRELTPRPRVQLMLCTATTLPLIVALTSIGLANGTMLPENASALLGAGVLSVMLFPATAIALERPRHEVRESRLGG